MSAAGMAQFGFRFERYLQEAREVRARNGSHDQRRELFLNFLHDAFGIDLSAVEREQYIQLRGGQRVPMTGAARVRKGWIDAVFRDLIFEFKRDLKTETEEGLRELRDYLSNIPNGDECVGLLTDGFKFIAYVLDSSVLDSAGPSGLRKIDELDLEKAAQTPNVAYIWLDAYLLSQRNLIPTSADIVRRFGLASPTFNTAARILREANAVFSATEAGASEVKRQQWAFYLARVYGSADARNNEMFVRHTYLCQFAKMLAYAARFGVEQTIHEIEGVINGSAFEVLGVSNIGEQDFFAWVLAPEVRNQTLDVFRHIAASLAVYDLKRIDEDLLKQLYQNLVEQETRHELGEFYTPDWLAELTLKEIGYGPGKSLLDPACGSGTFLFTALRLLSEQGVTGAALVNFALENIMGVDVHPLAVTIARINYMLALMPHLQAVETPESRTIPIVMANSLQVPDKAGPIDVIAVRFDTQREFRIPVEAARQPNELNQVLGEMQRQAEYVAPLYPNITSSKFGEYALKQLPASGQWKDTEYVRGAWNTNLRYLAEQIHNGRDSIWVYVLRNTAQPLFLRHRKFDFVVGNPPWIAYRYLQDESYRRDVKALSLEYGLIAADEAKLRTQMELSTLFYEHCSRAYLRPGGTIAFVMPRSVITGAKQHRAFQRMGFSRILDFEDVSPIFNVPTCVLVRTPAGVSAEHVSTTIYSGRLPARECKLIQINNDLTKATGATSLGQQQEVGSPFYHPRFKQAATLVPRNLVFVTSAQPGRAPEQLANTHVMRTDPDVDAEAKTPWKGISIQGQIDDEFLYATLLSKSLVPFGTRKLHLVAVPVRVGVAEQVADLPGQERSESFIPMSTQEMRDSFRFAGTAQAWFEPAERKWAELKSPTTKESLAEWLNYQNKITAQSPTAGYLVIYNAAGSNLASVVMDTRGVRDMKLNGRKPRAFILDHTAYWYRTASADEAHYLAALLNAPCVDAAIKPHQTRGSFGARHIHRRPFEVCTITEFDAANADHLQLAALSRQAHAAVAGIDLREGGVVAVRKKARTAAREYIEQIDRIAQRILNLAPAKQPMEESEEESDGKGEPEDGDLTPNPLP